MHIHIKGEKKTFSFSLKNVENHSHVFYQRDFGEWTFSGFRFINCAYSNTKYNLYLPDNLNKNTNGK